MLSAVLLFVCLFVCFYSHMFSTKHLKFHFENSFNYFYRLESERGNTLSGHDQALVILVAPLL